MNVRKPIDYSELFAAVDRAVDAALPQMELYQEIGRLICERQEKGAAVAVAEHLQSAYPDANGFSPRNVRRMREFYRTYADAPALMAEAMRLGWTQNVVIMEVELTMEERQWYIHAALREGWSKLALADKIVQRVHEDATLDTNVETCYTSPDEIQTEEDNDECAFRLPRRDMTEAAQVLEIA